MEEVKAYKCSFCKMLSRFKWRTEKHEKEYCRKNPNRKSCLICKSYYNSDHGPRCDVGDVDPDFYGTVNQNNDCETFEFNPTGKISNP